MYKNAMRFMSVNMAETAYRLCIYFFFPDAMRTSIKEMLNLMGIMAAQ